MSLTTRLGVLLFSGLFAFGFGAGGLFFGAIPLVRTFHAAWSVQSWEPVPARVLSSQLVLNNSSDVTTHKVQAQYRYSAGGRSHDATRIGVDPTEVSDNIGAWHQDWHARLSLARDTGQTVTAWVKPTVYEGGGSPDSTQPSRVLGDGKEGRSSRSAASEAATPGFGL